jgi:hypothetical protein
MHHPGEVGALGELFAGYGSRPQWPRRRAVMLGRCEQMVEMLRDGPDAAPRAQAWRDRAAATATWTE